jgi:hypothetical protein
MCMGPGASAGMTGGVVDGLRIVAGPHHTLNRHPGPRAGAHTPDDEECGAGLEDRHVYGSRRFGRDDEGWWMA